MNIYTNKENIIIKQCKEGPFHTLITTLSNDEFNTLVDKLITHDDSSTLINLVSIYIDYNRNKIIDYFIRKKDVELLLGFLDYCNDFCTPKNELNQKYIIDELLKMNDKTFIKNILDSNDIYFLTDKEQKDRLINFIKQDFQ